MKTIRMRIDPKSGRIVELKAEGYAGSECAADTERIRKAFGMTGEVHATEEMHITQDQQQRLEGA